MFTIEQIKKVRKDYEYLIKENKILIQANIKERSLIPVKREVSKRIFETTGKNKDYDKECDRLLMIYESHIEEFSKEIEELELEISILDQMIDECNK